SGGTCVTAWVTPACCARVQSVLGYGGSASASCMNIQGPPQLVRDGSILHCSMPGIEPRLPAPRMPGRGRYAPPASVPLLYRRLDGLWALRPNRRADGSNHPHPHLTT